MSKRSREIIEEKSRLEQDYSKSMIDFLGKTNSSMKTLQHALADPKKKRPITSQNFRSRNNQQLMESKSELKSKVSWKDIPDTTTCMK